MKTMLLMRHAEAEDEHAGCRDFDRALTPDGRKMARQTAELLKQQAVQVDLILTSAARRTIQTAQLVAEVICPDAPFIALDELYLAAPEAYVSAVRQQAEPGDQAVLVVGHNPGLAELLCFFAQDHVSVPPSTLSVFELPFTAWSDLSIQGQPECRQRCLIQGGVVTG